MHRLGRKIISVILAIVIALSSCIIFASAESRSAITQVDSLEAATAELLNDKHIDELERDEVYPTILIHGIGQAKTYMVDEDGNDVVDPSGER